MAVTEFDISRDEQERSSLQRAVSDLEMAITAANPGTRRVLERSLDGVKARVSTLDKRIEEAKSEQAAEVQTRAAAAAALAAKETKLNEQEQAAYRGFLEEAYFTKADFGGLQHFYAHSYDRLSDGGKDELSHRVWEGVRHDEYRFDDLPGEVKEKEAERLYGKMTAPDKSQASLAEIPAVDRDEFLAAYRTGKRADAYHVLERESFRRNVALTSSTGVKPQAATQDRSADDQGVLADNKPVSTQVTPDATSAMANLKAVSEKLKNLTLDDAPPPPSAAAIPNVTTPQVSGRSPA